MAAKKKRAPKKAAAKPPAPKATKPNVAADLTDKLHPIAKLKADPNNVRKHSERNLQAIADSLEQFGQQKTIVVNKAGVVLAGNGTYEAAKRLGWTHLAVTTFSGPAKDERAFALADNRTGELSAWDWENLVSSLIDEEEAGRDLQKLGWEDFELEPLLDTDYRRDEPKGLPPEQLKAKARAIVVTEEQRASIEKATVAYGEEHEGLSEGEAVARICDDFLRNR